MKTGLFQRDDLLRHAHLLITKSDFTHEDNARANALMSLAEKLGDGKPALPGDGAETRALTTYLRTGKIEGRDLGVGTPTQTTATNVLVQQGFYDKLAVALKAYDALFNDDVAEVIETDTGAPLVYPSLDDTANAAQVVTEGDADPTNVDPITAATLGTPSTYRTGLIKCSRELAEDSRIPIADILAQAFAIRIGRGVGPALVSALLSAAKVGPTANGSAANSGGSETGVESIGWTDLVDLVKSVDPAYRSARKCGWLMNDDTLLALDSVITKQGLPMVKPLYDAEGRRLLLGYPVGICPSMPDIGAGKTPIAFGATGYFITRLVRNSTRIAVLEERFAELGQIAYRAQTRANGTLLAVTSTNSPVKLLQNASL
jgi:HK97 family phage major capsid protein